MFERIVDPFDGRNVAIPRAEAGIFPSGRSQIHQSANAASSMDFGDADFV